MLIKSKITSKAIRTGKAFDESEPEYDEKGRNEAEPIAWEEEGEGKEEQEDDNEAKQEEETKRDAEQRRQHEDDESRLEYEDCGREAERLARVANYLEKEELHLELEKRYREEEVRKALEEARVQAEAEARKSDEDNRRKALEASFRREEEQINTFSPFHTPLDTPSTQPLTRLERQVRQLGRDRGRRWSRQRKRSIDRARLILTNTASFLVRTRRIEGKNVARWESVLAAVREWGLDGGQTEQSKIHSSRSLSTLPRHLRRKNLRQRQVRLFIQILTLVSCERSRQEEE
ncbi:hypothetical protein BLNAU_16894 [Blattamonas nauphoetae]|uniref:Uncharacterized protein n=1 Tax=Blattamonas nauphoetae TaxID=2049346 RepID=A0ABQ9XA39_9EUKA|nr:hypothetical protein BLNAU_16894 [Blattamonas nauphoetae]